MQVDSDTKIVGDPKVGDIVDVVAKVHNPPPGSLAPSYLVAVSIIKAPVITPPGPGDRATEFDGIVESIPAAPTANGAPLGHWKISSRDVLVNGLTKLDTGIVVGSAVHVKGTLRDVRRPWRRASRRSSSSRARSARSNPRPFGALFRITSPA